MSKRRVRYLVTGTTEAPATSTMRIRTRIEATDEDLVVLEALGRHFDRLQGADLAARCRPLPDDARAICALANYVGSLLGKFSVTCEDGTVTHRRPPSAETLYWGARKHALTAGCSSRWAGWVTKSSNDAYGLAVRNAELALRDKEKAIAAIAKKLKLTVHTQVERKALLQVEQDRAKAEHRRPRHLDFGYKSAHEHAMKRQRRDHLRSEADKLASDIAAGVVHVTRGGKKLMRTRLHLDEAGLTEAEWRARWRAKRWSFGANGETGKRLGNETIRVSPDGLMDVDLPPRLASLANVTARGVTRYRFDARVRFSYRGAEWRAQVEANRAVAYDVVLSESGRVYLDASFTPSVRSETPRLEALLARPDLKVLALDLNHGFLAPAVLDRSGNMVRQLPHIPLVTEGLPASTRDGHLRHAITEALDLATSYGCALVVVENLGFDDMRATGRERYGAQRWFRRVVCSIPTAQFRDRLVAMASRRAIAVAGVPAAYSSIWGREHWQAPLSTKKHKISGHTAAAVVLGRRALGQPARRRAQASPGVTASDQRIEATGQPVGVVSYRVRCVNGPEPECEGTSTPPRRKGSGQRQPTRLVGAHVGTEAANVEREVPSPAKTVRVGRVSLVGTQ